MDIIVSTDIDTLLKTADKHAARSFLGTALFSDTVPDNAIGANGDFAVVGSSGVIYKKTAGVWAAYSVSPTRLVHAVAAMPVNAFGTNGDLALLFTGGYVTQLLEKQTGAWVSLAAFGSASTAAVVHAVTSAPSGALGNDDDLALLITGGVVTQLFEKQTGAWVSLANFATAQTLPIDRTDLSKIVLIDDFIGGGDVTAAAGITGELGWLAVQVEGTGQARLGTNISGALGVLTLSTSATIGHMQAVCLQGHQVDDVSGFATIAALKAMANFVIKWRFKCDITNEFWLGFGYAPNATLTTPYRFVGVHAIPGTASFQFDCLNYLTLQRQPSIVAVDTAWHNFEVRWNSLTSKWAMRLDGGAEVEVTDTMTDDLRWSPYAWVEAKAAAVAKLHLDTFVLTANR